MNFHELMLNRIAQGLVSWESGVEWFSECSAAERELILFELGGITQQAHPRHSEVRPAIEFAGLKETYTPCALALHTDPPERAIHTITGLPEAEWLKSFTLLLSLFSIADRRRRETDCRDGCYHEWHHLDMDI